MSKLQNLASCMSLALVAMSCTSLQNSPALDALQNMVSPQTASKGVFVEAYFEYPGPRSEWAGPASHLVTVLARGADIAEVLSQPDFRSESDDSNVLNRAPASTGGKLPIARAREWINAVADAIDADHNSYGSCASPVRVRLIRSDGSFVDRQGCRGEQGWPGAVSHAVALFLAN